MGIDTQLHVKYRNADTARVELLQRKLLLLKQSGKPIQLQSYKQAQNAAACTWIPIVGPAPAKPAYSMHAVCSNNCPEMFVSQ